MNAILVPYDGARASEQAFPIAAALARVTGATVHLVTVRPATADAAPTTDWQPILPLFGELPTRSTEIENTEPAAALCQYAVEQGIDLIVMTTHGRGPLSRMWIGSVADEVARHADVPVLLVRVDAPTRPQPLRLLACLDGSPDAEALLGPAGDIAQKLRAELHLLRVVEPPLAADIGPDGFIPTAADLSLIDHLRGEAAHYLDQKVEALRPRGVTVVARVAVHPHAPTAIIEDAQAHACDWIVVATHGRGGLARLVLGSVADKIVRAAERPVLVVRARTPTT